MGFVKCRYNVPIASNSIYFFTETQAEVKSNLCFIPPYALGFDMDYTSFLSKYFYWGLWQSNDTDQHHTCHIVIISLYYDSGADLGRGASGARSCFVGLQKKKNRKKEFKKKKEKKREQTER